MNEKKFFFKTKIHFFCPKQTLNKFFWVHFVIMVSSHFRNQHKILRFFYTHHEGFKKKCLDPSYVHERIFRADSRNARYIGNFF
jgi:hypothetical protein